MAIRFSLVSVTAADKEANFFVGGIPKGFEDLEGWTAFDRFLEELDEDTEVSVHAESFLYGEGEMFDATPEEVAYMMKRMEIRPDFLSTRCTRLPDTEFSFDWSPEELFNFPFLEQ